MTRQGADCRGAALQFSETVVRQDPTSAPTSEDEMVDQSHRLIAPPPFFSDYAGHDDRWHVSDVSDALL